MCGTSYLVKTHDLSWEVIGPGEVPTVAVLLSEYLVQESSVYY